MNGIGLNTFMGTNLEAFKKTAAMSSDNYPELLMKCHITNAPWIFGGIWNTAQVLTPDKIQDATRTSHDNGSTIINDFSVFHLHLDILFLDFSRPQDCGQGLCARIGLYDEVCLRH